MLNGVQINENEIANLVAVAIDGLDKDNAARVAVKLMKQLGALQSTSDSDKPIPAMAIEKSVTDDVIYSLIDGKPRRNFRRYLSNIGLTEVEYKQMFDLPHDYPMVPANYRKHRANIAKNQGLGKHDRTKNLEHDFA